MRIETSPSFSHILERSLGTRLTCICASCSRASKTGWLQLNSYALVSPPKQSGLAMPLPLKCTTIGIGLMCAILFSAERPQISITRNPDISTDIREGDEVTYTCDVTAGPGGDEIESIYWQVGSSQFTDCRNAAYCVTGVGDNVRTLTVNTTGILTNMEAMTLDIECVVLQEFEDSNIIDPVSHNLTDMTTLSTSSGVSLLTIHPPPTGQ